MPAYRALFPTFLRWWADPRTASAIREARRGAHLAGTIVVAALRTLSAAPVLGVLYLAGVTWLALEGPVVSDEERVLGAARLRMLEGIFAKYSHELHVVMAQLLVVLIVTGALLGVIAGGLVALTAHLEARRPWRVERAAWTLIVIAVLQSGTFAWSMSRAPQLYERSWNHVGGGWRAFQTLVSSTLDPRAVAWAAAALVVASLILPVAVRRAWSLVRAAGPVETRESHELGAIARGATALVIVVSAFLFLPPRASSAVHASSSRPNVIILAADSFRDDRLAPSITPHLVALAHGATRFTHAYVTIPRTLPSWTTTLTGTWPHHHGIRTSFPREDVPAHDRDTIVSRFRVAGYATVAVSDYAGDCFNKIDFGFESVDAPSESLPEYMRIEVLKRAKPLLPLLHSELGRRLFPSMREIPIASDAGFVADEIVDAMRRRADRPLFLLGFFGAAHIPYAAPSPYFKRFTDPRYEGELKYDKVVWDAAWHATPEEAHQLRGLYDGGIASVDDAAARILEELDREHMADSTIVVVMGDHGQNLLEADRSYGHGSTLFGEEATHIPLVIRDPRRKSATGRVVAELVRDVDLAPTLCELADVPCSDAMDGRSLARALDGAPLEPRLAYGETGLWLGAAAPPLRIPYPGIDETLEIDERDASFVLRRNYEDIVDLSKHRMVFDGRWKLLYLPLPDGPREVLIDTVGDPFEVSDRRADYPDEAARLHVELWEWMLQDPKMEERNGWLAPRGVRVAYIDGDGIR